MNHIESLSLMGWAERAKQAEQRISKLEAATKDFLHEYDKWQDDASDGTYALWSADKIHASVIRLRQALQSQERK